MPRISEIVIDGARSPHPVPEETSMPLSKSSGGAPLNGLHFGHVGGPVARAALRPQLVRSRPPSARPTTLRSTVDAVTPMDVGAPRRRRAPPPKTRSKSSRR